MDQKIPRSLFSFSKADTSCSASSCNQRQRCTGSCNSRDGSNSAVSRKPLGRGQDALSCASSKASFPYMTSNCVRDSKFCPFSCLGSPFAISTDSQHLLKKASVLIITTAENFSFTHVNKCSQDSGIHPRISHFLIPWQPPQSTADE